MKLIPLSQGQFAMIDDADFEAVNAHKWCAYKSGGGFYAGRNVRGPDGKQHTQFLHQFLLPGVGPIDHIDGNRLNDQMGNLRPATRSQNARGFQRKKVGATSKFRGVCWYKRDLKWRAAINVNGKYIFLGQFINEEDAARAYDSAAVFYYGEYAFTNFPVGEISIT